MCKKYNSYMAVENTSVPYQLHLDDQRFLQTAAESLQEPSSMSDEWKQILEEAKFSAVRSIELPIVTVPEIPYSPWPDTFRNVAIEDGITQAHLDTLLGYHLPILPIEQAPLLDWMKSRDIVNPGPKEIELCLTSQTDAAFVAWSKNNKVQMTSDGIYRTIFRDFLWPISESVQKQKGGKIPSWQEMMTHTRMNLFFPGQELSFNLAYERDKKQYEEVLNNQGRTLLSLRSDVGFNVSHPYGFRLYIGNQVNKNTIPSMHLGVPNSTNYTPKLTESIFSHHYQDSQFRMNKEQYVYADALNYHTQRHLHDNK